MSLLWQTHCLHTLSEDESGIKRHDVMGLASKHANICGHCNTVHRCFRHNVNTVVFLHSVDVSSVFECF